MANGVPVSPQILFHCASVIVRAISPSTGIPEISSPVHFVVLFLPKCNWKVLKLIYALRYMCMYKKRKSLHSVNSQQIADICVVLSNASSISQSQSMYRVRLQILMDKYNFISVLRKTDIILSTQNF